MSAGHPERVQGAMESFLSIAANYIHHFMSCRLLKLTNNKKNNGDQDLFPEIEKAIQKILLKYPILRSTVEAENPKDKLMHWIVWDDALGKSCKIDRFSFEKNSKKSVEDQLQELMADLMHTSLPFEV